MKKSLGLFPILNLSKSMQWKIPSGQNITKFKQFTFSGGEEHIIIDKDHGTLIESADNMLIIGDTTSSSGIMKTFLATDAVRSYNPKINISLFSPYLPYARQDRRMVEGEPFSVKSMANIINLQNYNIVEVFDPHSDVSSALINNINVITNEKLVGYVYNKIIDNYDKNKCCIVSPDAGAEKKTHSLIKKLNQTVDIVCCTKKRNVETGKITDSYVPDHYDLQDKICIIVDDIIDGGYTFIELSKKLRAKGAQKVFLVVSHGIFSRGFTELQENIDHIYTSDSFSNINNELVTTVPLSSLFFTQEYYCTGKTRPPFDTRYL